MPSYEMFPLIFIEVDMILFKHNVLKMYLLNTHLSFHINSFNYFILFICFIEQFVGSILYRYIMFGRGICEKYQLRDEKFPEPNGERNLVSRCLGGVFAKNTSERRKISRAEWRGKFSLKTGIFPKYPSQT